MIKSLVITCVDFHQRHEFIFKQYYQRLAAEIERPRFILDFDKNSHLPFAGKEYCPGLWLKHLAFAAPLHINNIRNSMKEFNPESIEEYVLDYANFLAENPINVILPERLLTLPEHSLLHKHFMALSIIANSSSDYIVMEDDAILSDCSFSGEVSLAVSSLSELSDGFLNLCFSSNQFSPFRKQKKKGSNNSMIVYNSKAVTNTTCAYCITPKMAKFLISNFFPYSLPIDFHLQYLFYRYRVSGLSVTKPIFLNGSAIGTLKTTIQ